MESIFCMTTTPRHGTCNEICCYTQWHSIEENWFSPFQQIPIANCFLFRGGILSHSFSGLQFWLVWICSVLVHSITVFVSYYMYQTSSIWVMLFPWSHLPPLTVTIFLSFLPLRSLSLEGRGLIKTFSLELRYPKSLTFYILLSCSLCIN